MKTLFLPASLALLFSSLLYAQDAPPAFQLKDEDVEEPDPFSPVAVPARGETEYDHFDPYMSAPKSVRIQVEFIEMAHKDLTKLLWDYKSRSTDATPLRKKIQAMVEKDEAKVIESQIMMARSGEKATTESVNEYIYPTEYDPPVLPAKDDEKEDAPPALSFGYTPCAFETRNVGSTLEIEPTIGENDKMVNLRFVPEVIWHNGNTMWQEYKDEKGNTYKVEMPNFYTVRLNTALTVYTGQYVMAGALTPRDDKGNMDTDRKIMVFVKCDILATVR